MEFEVGGFTVGVGILVIQPLEPHMTLGGIGIEVGGGCGGLVRLLAGGRGVLTGGLPGGMVVVGLTGGGGRVGASVGSAADLGQQTPLGPSQYEPGQQFVVEEQGFPLAMQVLAALFCKFWTSNASLVDAAMPARIVTSKISSIPAKPACFDLLNNIFMKQVIY